MYIQNLSKVVNPLLLFRLNKHGRGNPSYHCVKQFHW